MSTTDVERVDGGPVIRRVVVSDLDTNCWTVASVATNLALVMDLGEVAWTGLGSGDPQASCRGADLFGMRVWVAAGAALMVLGGAQVSAAQPSGDMVGEAIASVQREIELVALAAPDHAHDPGFASNRAELRSVDQRGEQLLAQLRQNGYRLSDSVVRALSVMPRPEDGGTPVDPRVYSQALTDLRAMVGSPQRTSAVPAAAPAATASPWWSPWAIGAGAALAAVAAALVLRRRHRATLSMHKDLLDLAFTDSLTGLLNRRRLDIDLGRLGRLGHRGVIAMMIDVDHFKRFNDVYGHAMGDEVLRRVGSSLAASVRSNDVVYRYGGEEFCVLLDDAPLRQATVVAERILASVRTIDLGVAERVTVSIGLAEGSAGPVQQVVQHADQALFTAKRDGRDRVVVGAR